MFEVVASAITSDPATTSSADRATLTGMPSASVMSAANACATAVRGSNTLALSIPGRAVTMASSWVRA